MTYLNCVDVGTLFNTVFKFEVIKYVNVDKTLWPYVMDPSMLVKPSKVSLIEDFP